MSEELKSCPFCGKTNTLKIITAEELANEGEDDPLPWEHSASWAVVCDASSPRGPGGCGAMGGFMPTEAEAATVWNMRAQSAVVNESLTTEREICEWREEDPWGPMPDTYATSCGEMWSFVDGGPNENRVKFCHRCGKTVKVVPYPQPVDDADGVKGDE